MFEFLSSDIFTAALTGLAVSVIVVKLASGPAAPQPAEADDENKSTIKPKAHSESEAVGGDDGKSSETLKESNDESPPHIGSKSIDADSLKEGSIEKIPVINESHAMKKLAPLQNLLGLSDEQMSKVIQETNAEIAQDPSTLDAADSLSRSVDLFVFLCALLFGFYAINVWTHGDLGRMLLGFFPVEAASLKLADYLRDFR